MENETREEGAIDTAGCRKGARSSSNRGGKHREGRNEGRRGPLPRLRFGLLNEDLKTMHLGMQSCATTSCCTRGVAVAVRAMTGTVGYLWRDEGLRPNGSCLSPSTEMQGVKPRAGEGEARQESDRDEG